MTHCFTILPLYASIVDSEAKKGPSWHQNLARNKYLGIPHKPSKPKIPSRLPSKYRNRSWVHWFRGSGLVKVKRNLKLQAQYCVRIRFWDNSRLRKNMAKRKKPGLAFSWLSLDSPLRYMREDSLHGQGKGPGSLANGPHWGFSRQAWAHGSLNDRVPGPLPQDITGGPELIPAMMGQQQQPPAGQCPYPCWTSLRLCRVSLQVPS